MKYAKILVKNNYEKRGDLVLRSYIRALKKINAKLLLDGDNAFIYGKVDENGIFHEWITKNEIVFDHYEQASTDEILGLDYLSLAKLSQIRKVILHVIFGQNIDFDFEISSIEDLALDRAIEFEAYINFLSRINPYMRLNSSEDLENYNAYNNFLSKITQIKKLEELDKVPFDEDPYEVHEYLKRDDSPEKNYFYIQNTKKLIRK